MSQTTVSSLPFPASSARDLLTQILQEKASQLLAQAVEAEAESWLIEHAGVVDEQGHRQVVRNGHLPTREILTGIGPVDVTQPRIRDKRPPETRGQFTSKILPPYLRKARSIEDLIPWLYLKGISTGDMAEALQPLVGSDAAGLSLSVVSRLVSQWQEEFHQWKQCSLEGKTYVYLWAAPGIGIYFNIRLEDHGNDRHFRGGAHGRDG